MKPVNSVMFFLWVIQTVLTQTFKAPDIHSLGLFPKKSSDVNTHHIIFCQNKQKKILLCHSFFYSLILRKIKGKFFICNKYITCCLSMNVGYIYKHLFKYFKASLVHFKVKLWQLVSGKNSIRFPGIAYPWQYCKSIVEWFIRITAVALLF